MTTALIAEDEPLLGEELGEELTRLWPALKVEAVVHDGHAALRAIEAYAPEILFLDVQMPGLGGLEVARVAGAQSQVVFITAFDHYEVKAFEAGAIDYLLKPLDPARLAQTVKRLKSRIGSPPADVRRLLAQLERPSQNLLRFITVLRGREIHLITVEEICYLRADSKYVSVVTAESEALVTKPLKELLGKLDCETFWQIHRGIVVNAHAIRSVRRSLSGYLEVQLKERNETLRVSPSYAHLFRHM